MSDAFFCLKCVKVLQDLTDDDLREISSAVREQHFAPGELIYIPGESEGQVFFIREGEVDIYQKGSGGKKFIEGTLESGDMFGDINLVPRSSDYQGHFARAVNSTRVCVVDKLAFMDYLQRKPQIAYRIIEELSARLAHTESKVRDLALNNVTIRLLNELRRLAGRYGESNEEGTIIKKHFTHEELAQRVSATRETITKVMNHLERKGFVRYDTKRNIVIHRDKLSSNL